MDIEFKNLLYNWYRVKRNYDNALDDDGTYYENGRSYIESVKAETLKLEKELEDYVSRSNIHQ